jgi:succinoglycan biosynthesis protein ExoA
MDQPTVSLITPVLNEARHIEAYLACLAGQDYPQDKMEILLADGGSTDGTRERITAFAATHPNIRLLDNPKRIQPAGSNVAIRAAGGEIIIRVDAHSEYPADFVSRSVRTLLESGADAAGGRVITRPSGGGIMAGAVALCSQSRFGTGAARFRTGGKAGPVDTVPFGAYHRHVFDRIGLLNEELVRGEDNEFNGRVRAAGMTIYFNPEIASTYFSRPTLASHLKQQWGNGFYHFLTLSQTRQGVSIRHLIPFGFVMTLVAAAAAGFFWWPAWVVGAGVLVLYFAAAVAAAAGIAAREGWKYLPVLPPLFFLTHLAYGAATLAGALRCTVSLPYRLFRGR